MTTARDLHDRAMALAQDAAIARYERNNLALARDLSALALAPELEAARMIAKEPDSEPTRSILYLSAASLSFDAGNHDTARTLAEDGLSGWPAPRTEAQLRELLAAINGERR